MQIYVWGPVWRQPVMFFALSAQQMWHDAVLFMLIAAFCLNSPAVYLHAGQSLLFEHTGKQVYMDFSTNYFYGLSTLSQLIFYFVRIVFFFVVSVIVGSVKSILTYSYSIYLSHISFILRQIK